MAHQIKISAGHRWPSGTLKPPAQYPAKSFFVLQNGIKSKSALTFKLIQLINNFFHLNHLAEESPLVLWVLAIGKITTVHQNAVLVFFTGRLGKVGGVFGRGSLQRHG